MKRATLLLEDQIYNRIKMLSHKQGATMKEVLNDLLRGALNSLSAPKRKSFKIPLHKRSGPKPGVDISDRNSLNDLMGESFKY